MGIRIRNNGQGGRITFRNLGLGGHITSGWPVTSNGLLLDTYSGAAAAYSLRKLNTSYSGSAIRVRRSSDNTEQDIGFVNGVLDTTALLDFVNGENYLLYSQDFTQNSWTKTSVTVTSSSGIAPDGTNTAQKCVPSAAVTIKAIYQTLQSVSTRDYVFSMYAKASEYNYMQLLAVRDSSNRYSIIVDLTTGLITQTNTVGTPNFINSSVTSVGNGWYRIVITLNINLGVNYFVFSPSPVANPTLDAELNMLSAGNGTSGVLFWGAQLNYISLKPYIGTTAAFATPTTTNGFVTTWYDQSGNGRNVTQTTAGNQPYIVGSGVLNLSNGKPAIFFTRTESDRLTTSGIISGNISRTQIVVYQPTAGHSALAGGVWGQASNAVNGTWSAIQSRSTTGAIGDPYFAGYSRDLGNGLTTENTSMKIGSFIYNGTTGYLWKNNTQLTSGALTLNTAIGDFTQIGSTGGGSAVLEPLQGNISECILYLTNQLSNISAINSNINSYYSIY